MLEEHEFSDGDLGITERFLCEAAGGFEHLARLYRSTARLLRDIQPGVRADIAAELVGVTRRTVLLVFRLAFGRDIDLKERKGP
jgi:hypothetical protein